MSNKVSVPCFSYPRTDGRLRLMHRIRFPMQYKAHPPRFRRPPGRPSPPRIHESHGRDTRATSYTLRYSSSSLRAVLDTFFLADQCTSFCSSCHPCRSLQAPPPGRLTNTHLLQLRTTPAAQRHRKRRQHPLPRTPMRKIRRRMSSTQTGPPTLQDPHPQGSTPSRRQTSPRTKAHSLNAIESRRTS